MKQLSTWYARLWATLVVGVWVLAGGTAAAQVTQLSQYSFTSGTGSAYDVSSGYTTLLGANTDDGLSATTNLGFNFTLGGTTYSNFEANSNGYMVLGTAASGSGCCGYTLTSIPSTERPAIAIFSEDMHNGSDGYVGYKMFGTAPNRVGVIHWKTREYPGSGQATHTAMQIRLYEGSNKIELYYGANGLTTSHSGGIGVIINSSNFASVNSGTVSYTSASTSNFPSNGRLYSFTPCASNVLVEGNIQNGGTAGMSDGDSLLVGFHVMRGSARGTGPFTLRNGNPTLSACDVRSYQFTISGANAGDYSISPTSGTLGKGESVTPTITFRPGALGLREATLRLTDDAGLAVEYKLHGTGITRIGWDGNEAQGGTANVLDGDTLINGIHVEFGSVGTFQPLILTDINNDPLETPPAQITYSLDDPIGNYSIAPTTTSITGGQQSIPTITFNAQGIVGIQEATLTVNADGDIRRYLLRAYNAAPGGRLISDIEGEITNSTALFVDREGCVGEEVVSIRVTAENTGAGPFIIRGADFFRTDTIIMQGTPPYPLLRNQNGSYISSQDYFLTLNPATSPRKDNPMFDSLVVPEKQSRVFYINMIANRPGKRFATAIIRTNAFNLSDPNIDGVPTRGTLRANVFGRGMGSILEFPGSVDFGPTEVRETKQVTAMIRNNGECDLRIRKSELRIVSGDLSEFEIVSALANTPLNGDSYLMAPGMEDSIVVRFTPNTYGSRRATVRLVTNDSTFGDGLVTEIGVAYFDLFGTGKTGLEVRGVHLPPAVIDGESSFGAVRVENTSGGNTLIESITIEGPTGEIIEDASRPWPALPMVVRPAESYELWVELRPDATEGTGDRASEMVITLGGGDVIRVPITGYVGSRTVQVSPSALFTNVKIQAGSVARGLVVVSNTGSLPVRMNTPVLVSNNPGDYEMKGLPRRVLEPGQTEFIEVYYTPQATGQSGGTLTFSSNATNGDQVVTLGGEGMTIGAPVDPVGTGIRVAGDQNATAQKSAVGAGLSLSAVVPNPVRGTATIGWNVAEAGAVELGLYDASGRLVTTILQTEVEAGAGTTTLDVAGLSAGIYHITLRQGNARVSYPVTVVK